MSFSTTSTDGWGVLFGRLLLLLMAATARAAPSITGVSGTFSGNADSISANVVTITGSSFGTKTQAKPLIWATFEAAGGLPTALGSVSSWTNAEHAERCSTVPAVGSWSACSDSTWLTDSSNKEWNLQYSTTIARGGKFYVFQKHAVTYDASDLNWKWFRVWATEGAQPDFYIGTQGITAASRNLTVEADPDMTKNASVAAVYAHPGTDSSYHTEVMLWKANSAAGVQDGSFTIWKDGLTATTATWSSDSTTNPGVPAHIFLEDDPSNGNPATDKRGYRDDVYMDSTWSRVVVGNASTFAASTQLEHCIPSAWSDTSISCYFHQGDYNTNDTPYFFVCDSDNSCSAGVQITVGGVGAQGSGINAMGGSFRISGSGVVR